MRTIIRRIVIFPIMFVGSPLVYFIAWCCFEGHKNAKELVCKLLDEVWNGF